MRLDNQFSRRAIYLVTRVSIALLLIISPNISISAHDEINLKVSHPFFAREIQQQIVSSIFRDSSDLLWIGTQEGLFRFDGYHLTQYHPGGKDNQYLQSSDIRGIVEDQHGRIVVATFGGGLLVSNQEKNSFSSPKIDHSYDLNTLNSIFALQDGSLWVTTKESLISLNQNYSVKTALQYGDELQSIGDVTGIVSSERGAYYVGGNRGLGYFQIGKSGKPTSLKILYAKGVHALTDNGDRLLFAAQPDGSVLKIDPNLGVIRASSFDLSREINSVSKLLWISDKLWVGTNSGLKIYNSDLIEVVELTSDNSSLSNPYVTDVHSSNGHVWLGTYQGINVVSESNIGLYTKKTAGINDDVHAFGEDEAGNLWVGTYDGLFVKRSDQPAHQRWDASHGAELLDQRIMTLATIGKEVWLGFRDRGVQVLNSQSDEVHLNLSKMTLGFAVTKILHTESGPVWIATYNRGLHRFDGVELNHYPSIPEKSVTVIFERRSSQLLAVSERRLFHFIPELNRFSEIELEFEDLSHSPRILSLAESATGKILVGTKDHGLYSAELDTTDSNSITLRKVGTGGKYRTLTIYSIHLDQERRVWVSTQEGIQVFDSAGSPVFTLRSRDGLQANDFNFGASLKAKNGSLYFGGVLGYNRINPNETSISSQLPLLKLLRISTSKHSVDTTTNTKIESLVTTYKDHFVTFTFSFMDFVSPEAHQYRYKLEGFDPDWVDNGNRNTATYTNLPPGDYVFRVIGANSAGIWNEDGVQLAVKVLPPAWLTWWAYCIYAVGILGLFWTGKKFYDTYAVKEQAVKMAEDMVATAHRVEDELQSQQELQDEMVQEIYRHNLDTLELLKQSATRAELTPGQSSGLQRQVDILSLLEENYFYQPEGLLANLSQFTDALITRLLPEASVPVESITTINKVPQTLIPAQVASPIALVLFELLENSLLHAFDQDSPANYIEVEMAEEDIDGCGRHYTLTVSDTGRGLSSGLDPESANTPGFALIRTLANHSNGTFSLSTDQGCVATFSIPLGHTAS